MRPGYSFPPEWSEEALPLNTAFFYINDEKLKDYYTRESFRFMLNERETPDYWSTCIVTAEQRIIGMCAEAMGIYGKVLWETNPKHELVTHFWSAKGQIKYDDETREYFLDLSEKILRKLRNN